MTQHEDRIQARIDRAVAAKHRAEWVKHTINLQSGTELDRKFKECGNKSHLVRESFKRLRELSHEVTYLRQENQQLMANIAKLQVVITDGFDTRAAAHPNQMKLGVEEE
tara:strand:+ start:1261 stop:1587 length:327 start_codon:yes stop_codon:yes gene_type:complete